jgi:hypothetical protein
MQYTRSSPTFSETSVSPSFLRTTPAKKPRTECCCHPVAFMIAAMVPPLGAAQQRDDVRLLGIAPSSRGFALWLGGLA